ncbi:MAG: adenylate/guanylate cyclase domain-containing protein [Nevskiaceae bacterium]|nr:MAG: adenylate/guanylate cyclase domain-containing protein [Nevskiaceae bacterium]
MQTCPTCQASNPANARFCNQCGERLAEVASPPQVGSYTPKHLADRIFKGRAALQGERKRVTVLFADIKGSTKLAQEAGAEAWHGILDRFFSILSGAVHRYEGTVNQYTGDGIMALFGAPIAHEDHAQRACRAALEMQAEVRRFADELRLSRGLNLSMRVGLNTGEVIVGRIGDDLRMDYTAQGLTVNLAARMEHICEPGRVYLSRYTARGVEGYFELRDLGRMSVAGLDEPVEVYELIGTGALRTRLDRSLSRGGSEFVGRERELRTLLAALDRVRAGEGQVVAVVGNAGIGKSRLCHEFATVCERAGIPVYRATGVPYSSALPLYPVQTLVRARLGLSERASAADVRRLVAGTFLLHDPAHAAVLPRVFEFLGVSEGRERAPEQTAAAREKMFELFAEYLPCAEGPQILLIEDLHFLDAASEEFIARLCANIRGNRTLLLLNYRPDYISEYLIPFVDEQIAVSALSAAQLEQLASHRLGSHPSLDGVAAMIRQRASGNPFFVEEAVQALAESGHLRGDVGGYELARPIEQWPIPDTVHALLAARIDRLPVEHKTLLQTAAVIGQEFAGELLSELAAAPDFEPQLSALEDSGFVHQRHGEQPDQYAFCHPLMQEVAYHAQLESQRAQAHARLAQALESRQPAGAPPDETSVRIAHHWRQAGQWAKAGEWSLRAAGWASSRDIRATVHQYRLARDSLDRAAVTPEVIRLRIVTRAGLIRMAQFAEVPGEEIETAYLEARALAEQSGDTAGSAELLISYSNEQLHRGHAEVAAKLAAEAVRLCIAHGQEVMVQRFRLTILLTHNAAGRPREGIALVDAAGGSQWRTEPIDENNFMSRGFYGLMLTWMGELREAEDNLYVAVTIADREDRSASWMHANLVDFAWFTGRHAVALDEARKAYERSQKFGSPFFLTLALRALGLAHCLRGEYAQAIGFLEQGRAQVAPGGLAHQFEANFLSVLCEAYAGVGRFEDALATGEAAIASAQRSGSRVWEIRSWIALLALPKAITGAHRAEQGFARLNELIAMSGAHGFEPWRLRAQVYWAETPELGENLRQRAAEAFLRMGLTEQARRQD